LVLPFFLKRLLYRNKNPLSSYSHPHGGEGVYVYRLVIVGGFSAYPDAEQEQEQCADGDGNI
jgi:hypothetical protein